VVKCNPKSSGTDSSMWLWLLPVFQLCKFFFGAKDLESDSPKAKVKYLEQIHPVLGLFLRSYETLARLDQYLHRVHLAHVAAAEERNFY
jgi:hypothetical protein